MKTFPALAIAALVLVQTGCTSNRTQGMATTCQSLLEQDETSSDRRFIREADKQLAALNEPSNKLTRALRDIQDKDALIYKPQLEQCLLMLKSRQS